MAQKVTVVDMGKKRPVNLQLVHPATALEPASHLDKILSAKTLDDLDSVVKQARQYEYASPKTRKRWERAEKARRDVLLKEARK